MKMMYLVTYEIEGKIFHNFESEKEIFSKMDMDDCYDITIKNILLCEEGKLPVSCQFFGTWHNIKDPLRMEVRNLITNELYSIGYGTDH